MTDTVAYWLGKAREALDNAADIAERTNTEIHFELGTQEFTYIPQYTRLGKTEAIELLSSGEELTEAQRNAIRIAIENETILDDDTWYSSSTGWVTSSDLC